MLGENLEASEIKPYTRHNLFNLVREEFYNSIRYNPKHYYSETHSIKQL